MTALIVLLILAPLAHLGTLLILDYAERHGEPIVALRERKVVAQVMLLSSTTIALLALNVQLGRPLPIEPPVTTIVLVAALLILAIPSVVFIVLWFTRRFGDESEP